MMLIDPYRDFEREEERKQKQLESCQACDQCGEYIQEEKYILYDGEIFCLDCWDEYVHDNFMREVI